MEGQNCQELQKSPDNIQDYGDRPAANILTANETEQSSAAAGPSHHPADIAWRR